MMTGFYTLPLGRWVFEIRTTLPGCVHVSRSEAWERCKAAGERAGIPQHAWRKSHTGGHWRWYTASFEEIDRQTNRMMNR